jgi:hypothetical protein
MYYIIKVALKIMRNRKSRRIIEILVRALIFENLIIFCDIFCPKNVLRPTILIQFGGEKSRVGLVHFVTLFLVYFFPPSEALLD